MIRIRTTMAITTHTQTGMPSFLFSRVETIWAVFCPVASATPEGPLAPDAPLDPVAPVFMFGLAG